MTRSQAQKTQVIENMFSWIKKGEEVSAAGQLPGWSEFLRKGPGTGLKVSTSGSYLVLEFMTTNLKWSGISRVEAHLGVVDRFADRVWAA